MDGRSRTETGHGRAEHPLTQSMTPQPNNVAESAPDVADLEADPPLPEGRRSGEGSASALPHLRQSLKAKVS